MNKEQWSASEWFVKMNIFVMVWSIPGIIKFFTRRMMVEMDLVNYIMCIFVIIMVSAAIIYKGRYANKAIVNQELDLRVILSYDVMIVFLCMVALLLKKHLQVINIAITGISIIYILSTLLNKK